jgi:membrane protease subunit (stomatin/prohibitin family)
MGLLRMAARTAVVAGTATAVSGRVAHRQNEKWAAQDQAQYDQQQAAYDAGAQAQAQQAQVAAPDPNAELQNLANLHSQGVLTDEEFAAAKAKILGI